jgi:peptidoglycan lytic transglycosylase G
MSAGRSTGALELLLLLGACAGPNPTSERVTLPPGATFAAVTDTLAAHRVVANRGLFKLIARVRGVDRSVQAGVYEFPPGTSPWKVLDVLARGAAVSRKFTVPEGLTIPEVAALAAERLGLAEDSVIAAARDAAAATAVLGFPAKSFEGFLRPETYTLPLGVGGDELVRIMADGFKEAWDPAWNARLDSLGMTQLQLVTFASIVEGEARADEERETIAGVYHNRLRIGMALQADPTVQYAIALATGKRKPRLYEKDYQFPSPYNTYLHPGLPPGPVNSPSRRSIEASLHPAKVPYLYFVAGPDGRHVFARTYAEHLRNIARVRQDK